jgi:predicted neutral ceramidase superfamily lipid hydrolase
MADSLALALIAWGIALWLSERFHVAAISLGLATVIHKGTWMFVILLLLAGIITRRRFPWTALLIAACPLGLLWVAGMNENGYGPFWLLSVSLPIQFATKSTSLPDELMGTILKGRMKSLTKSVILWAHVALLVTLCVALFREPDPAVRWLGLAVVLGLLFLYGGLNQNIIWAAMRYSKIAAIPLGFYLGTKPRVTAAVAQHPWIIVPLVMVLLASQFAYCWYMARDFWAP